MLMFLDETTYFQLYLQQYLNADIDSLLARLLIIVYPMPMTQSCSYNTQRNQVNEYFICNHTQLWNIALG